MSVCVVITFAHNPVNSAEKNNMSCASLVCLASRFPRKVATRTTTKTTPAIEATATYKIFYCENKIRLDTVVGKRMCCDCIRGNRWRRTICDLFANAFIRICKNIEMVRYSRGEPKIHKHTGMHAPEC